MGAPPYVEEPEEAEEWLTTYADAITLLMAFFVMLVSFSKIDIPTFEQVAAGIKNELGKRDTQSPISLLKVDVQDVVYQQQADQAVNVESTDKGISIELSSNAFYKPGSAEIREEAIPVLSKIFESLNGEKYQLYFVDVEGHTDDVPIHTERFPSNWELSTARATTVVRFFVGKGMEPERLKATGFAETRPKVPNIDENGKPLPENRATNRRVAIEVYPMDLKARKAMQLKLDEKREREAAAKAKADAEKAAAERAKAEAERAKAGTQPPAQGQPAGAKPADAKAPDAKPGETTPAAPPPAAPSPAQAKPEPAKPADANN